MINKLTHLTKYLYRHHFMRYIAVGGTTFIIDFGILFFLHGILKLNLAVSTSVAYWIAIIYNFILNRYWTFDIHEKTNLKNHITTYVLLLIINYLFTVTFVSIVGTHINYIAAKVFAVLIQTSWTYHIYKNHIFVKRERKGTI